MSYQYKRLQELAWAVLVAVGVVAAQAMLTVDPDTISDWRTWATGVAAASVRAVGGALLAWLGATAAAAGSKPEGTV